MHSSLAYFWMAPCSFLSRFCPLLPLLSATRVIKSGVEVGDKTEFLPLERLTMLRSPLNGTAAAFSANAIHDGGCPPVLAGRSWRGHHAPLRGDHHAEYPVLAPSRPTSFGGQGRVGHGRPVMNMEGESLTPEKERVRFLRDNLQALQDSGNEGRPILSVNLGKYDRESGLGNQLRAIVAAAKKMDVCLMFNVYLGLRPFTNQEMLFFCELQANIRGAVVFDDIPLDTKLALDLSYPDQAMKTIDSYAKAGCDIITFYPLRIPSKSVERVSLDTVTAVLDRIKSHGILGGFVIRPGTSVKSIKHLLKHNELDMVVIMLMKPGHGSSMYIDTALENVRTIKQICQENKVTEPYISVDGEVNEENALMFLKEGVNVIVARSSVTNAVSKAMATHAARMASLRALVRKAIGEKT